MVVVGLRRTYRIMSNVNIGNAVNAISNLSFLKGVLSIFDIAGLQRDYVTIPRRHIARRPVFVPSATLVKVGLIETGAYSHPMVALRTTYSPRP